MNPIQSLISVFLPRMFFIVLCVLVLSSCTGLMNMGSIEQMTTRTEKDIYTKTIRDTAIIDAVRNAPGQRDNGIVYPTSRIVEMRRDVLQIDSTIVREYPNFIRLGLLESVGLIGSGNVSEAIGGGLFGIFGFFNQNYDRPRIGNTSTVFPGAMYRFGIMEKRLRWFNDDPDWTLGTSFYEMIYGDDDGDNRIQGIAPLYLRKRFWLKETIPYIAITPALGISLIPDAYVNLSVSADIGSLGGLNLRTYLGVAAPFAQKNIIPYVGIGTSVMDFLNKVPETEVEWKYHEHSSWQVGMLSLMGAITNADKPYFDPKTNSPIKGIIARIAPVSLVIPLGSHKFYAGTSLVNLMLLGQQEGGIGILPLRVGYWQSIISKEASLEPFFEYNYYPSAIAHIGAKISLRISNQINAFLQAGYANGSPVATLNRDYAALQDFDIYYVGIGLGLYDRIFFPEEIRYNK